MKPRARLNPDPLIGAVREAPVLRGQWHLALELHAEALRLSDPVPMLIAQLEAIPGVPEQCSVIYTVLSELYSNALGHGVLALSSGLKQVPGGFERYLEARETGLAELREGWVKLTAVCTQHEGGGELVVRAEDSGRGFDWQRH